MALIQVNYLSCALYRTVPVNVVLPIDRIDYDKAEYLSQSREPFKTLYLLHGLLGNHTDWISGTRIQRWAEEKNLAVVMPSGENSYYFNANKLSNRYRINQKDCATCKYWEGQRRVDARGGYVQVEKVAPSKCKARFSSHKAPGMSCSKWEGV